MRIGMVCPYSLNVPGGVQSHVLQLAEVMRERGHFVSVLAPSSPDVVLPDYVVSGGQRPPFELLAERLRQNVFVCLMAERDLTRSGVEVDFFGELTRMPAGSAKLAIATGAPLHPVHVYYDGEDCVVEVHDALDTSSGDVSVITQALADRFAANIAAHPEDWRMLQPQWIADLSESRRARLES